MELLIPSGPKGALQALQGDREAGRIPSTFQKAAVCAEKCSTHPVVGALHNRDGSWPRRWGILMLWPLCKHSQVILHWLGLRPVAGVWTKIWKAGMLCLLTQAAFVPRKRELPQRFSRAALANKTPPLSRWTRCPVLTESSFLQYFLFWKADLFAIQPVPASYPAATVCLMLHLKEKHQLLNHSPRLPQHHGFVPAPSPPSAVADAN